jgi:hypothetical protein
MIYCHLFHISSKFDFFIGVEMVMCHALICVKEIHQSLTWFTFLYHRNTVLWVLTMSKTVSVLYETGTDYLSRAHMFISISVCMVSVYLAHLFMFPLLCFLFCLSSFCVLCPMLPVSLDYPFLVTPSVFSNVYLTSSKQYFSYIHDKNELTVYKQYIMQVHWWH